MIVKSRTHYERFVTHYCNTRRLYRFKIHKMKLHVINVIIRIHGDAHTVKYLKIVNISTIGRKTVKILRPPISHT